MFKKINCLVILSFLISSCGGTFDSVKKGLTGSKEISTDEFLIKKKDPLILPPNYEDLPTPEEQKNAQNEDILKLEKQLRKNQTDQSSSSPIERSILEKIKTK